MVKVWVSLCAAALALATGLAGAPVAAQSNQPTIAVLDFDFGTVDRWWSGSWDIGKGISDMVVDELVNDGSFRVIERNKLDAIMAEQNLSNSDRADPSAASIAKLRKILGVKYMVVGSITKFGTENNKKGVSGGGGAGAVGGIEMGSSDFRETVLGEATELAVKDTATKLIEGKARLQE